MPALVPVARAAQAAGHEVAIATEASVAADLGRLGVPVVVLPDVLAPGEMGRRPELLDRALLEKLRHWRPEVTGAGVRVDAAGLTADGLAAAVSRVLGEPSYRSAALDFRRRIGEQPPITEFVTDLEAMAG